MATYQVQDLCEQILHQVKTSQLNFSISETPFSLEIKIKKKFVKAFSEQAKTSSKLPFCEQAKPNTKLNFSPHQNLSMSDRNEQKMSIPNSQLFPIPPPGYPGYRAQAVAEHNPTNSLLEQSGPSSHMAIDTTSTVFDNCLKNHVSKVPKFPFKDPIMPQNPNMSLSTSLVVQSSSMTHSFSNSPLYHEKQIEETCSLPPYSALQTFPQPCSNTSSPVSPTSKVLPSITGSTGWCPTSSSSRGVVEHNYFLHSQIYLYN